jgi:hypothetical protein
MNVDLEAVPKQLEALAQNLPPVSFEGLQYRQYFQAAPDCKFCTYIQEKTDYANAEKDSLAGATG